MPYGLKGTVVCRIERASQSRRRDSGVVKSGKESRRDVGGEYVNLVRVLTVGKDDVDLRRV